ncbi:MAG: cytochrome c biogenesis protein ResB [Desulfobacteraceae bacterium]|nr:MAG: cytochrome c biogenesis protein ResB [Desulfobacteraceae bacterium]
MEQKKIISPGITESVWRFLASLKLTVVLLLCLAVLSIIGTVIPQNLSPQDYINRHGLFGYRLFVLFDINDMYHSWWFLGLLFLVVINIVVCSVDRLQSTAKIIFVKRPDFDLQQYRKRKNRRDFSIAAPAESLKESYRRFLAKRFGFCDVVSTEKGFAITAEKGRWTRLGVYMVHLSIVLLLFGGLVGAKYGFEGFVAIPEGQTADTIQLNRSGKSHTLPFVIRCDDFDLQFYEGSRRPKEFRSGLTIIEEGREVLRKDIVVNDPLTYKGIGIYQSSYGPLDDRSSAPAPGDFNPSETIELAFRSAASGMIYTHTLSIGQAVQIAEGLGEFVLQRYEPSAEFRGMALGPALIGTLKVPGGEPQTVTLPLKYPKFDSMRGGTVSISISRMPITPVQERFYTGLQVVYDPGVGVVYAGFILMIAGCAVAFFMSHQQVVTEVTASGKRSTVSVSGKSNKNKMGFEMKLNRLSEQLKALAARGTGPAD